MLKKCRHRESGIGYIYTEVTKDNIDETNRWLKTIHSACNDYSVIFKDDLLYLLQHNTEISCCKSQPAYLLLYEPGDVRLRNLAYFLDNFDTDISTIISEDLPDWSLLPYDTLSEVVKVLTFGAKKHSPHGWKKIAKSVYFAKAMRHIAQYQNGHNTDHETGLHPLAHAICDLLFLLWHEQRNKGT